MKDLYDKVSLKASKIITNMYSTSFSLGIRFLHHKIQDPIYSIYGFVRIGDEIVDSFHEYDKKWLLDKFRTDVNYALKNKISLNPILNSFQRTVHEYKIEYELIDQFIHSMEMDLHHLRYTKERYEEYILGSAEVVGLMCLQVFCNGNDALYQQLKPYAMKLGSAYQKINFLRDLYTDFNKLGRTYFPGIDVNNFTEETKQKVISDLEKDFKEGYRGIKLLPRVAKFGVYLSYIYYYGLLNKIKKTSPSELLQCRIRISNKRKYALLFSSAMRYKLNLL